MLFDSVADVSLRVGATRSRLAKTAILADALRRAETAEVPVLVAYLAGELRQRRTGVGPAALRSLPEPSAEATLTVLDVDRALHGLSELAGPGSAGARSDGVRDLMARATAREQSLLARLILGELRQGASRAALLDAVAAATDIAPAPLRRAVTLTGDPVFVAGIALADRGLDERLDALAAITLRVGTGLSPMLAQAAPDVADALSRTGPAGVEQKLDGVRVQVHRARSADGGADRVRIFTRTLDDITARLPDVVALVSGFPGADLVLDGEVLGIAPDGRPAPFQQTMSRVSTRSGRTRSQQGSLEPPLRLHTVFFDVLHADGRDLVDEPGHERRRILESVVPAAHVVPRTDCPRGAADADSAAQALATSLAAGHEGVVVKSLTAPYAMGRRGAGWVKVKPRHTYDLVVLAAEWGHGRRTGVLSNLHLGARDPDGRYGPAGGFVMLGKTFKGLTDEMLRWQTTALRELATRSGPHQVDVRPELVVEIAVDGVQTSTRYPAGVALRFARVLRHRPDKPARQADTVDAIRSLLAVPAQPTQPTTGR